MQLCDDVHHVSPGAARVHSQLQGCRRGQAEKDSHSGIVDTCVDTNEMMAQKNNGNGTVSRI